MERGRDVMPATSGTPLTSTRKGDMVEEQKIKILALHEILKEEFTEEQLRIMLVATLEKIHKMNHDDIAKTLDKFYTMFNKKTKGSVK